MKFLPFSNLWQCHSQYFSCQVRPQRVLLGTFAYAFQLFSLAIDIKSYALFRKLAVPLQQYHLLIRVEIYDNRGCDVTLLQRALLHCGKSLFSAVLACRPFVTFNVWKWDFARCQSNVCNFGQQSRNMFRSYRTKFSFNIYLFTPKHGCNVINLVWLYCHNYIFLFDSPAKICYPSIRNWQIKYIAYYYIIERYKYYIDGSFRTNTRYCT